MDKIITLINEIDTLAMKINLTGNHAVFFSYSGHVNAFEVRACIGGWVEDANPDYEKTVWGLEYSVDAVKELEEIKENLYDLISL